MINHFTFNGTSTAQLGLIVSGVSIFGAGSRKVEKARIPGRNGDLQIELGGFNNYTVRYTVSITNDFFTTAQQIREWLLESKGYCELTDTYHPDEIRKACFNSDIEFTTTMLYKYGQASIQFDCLPQRYMIRNTPITTTPTEDTTTNTAMSLNTVLTPIKITLNGNTTQEGTPTPEAPQAIHNVSGDNTVNVVSKNIMQITRQEQTINNVKFTPTSDGTILVNGTASANVSYPIYGSTLAEKGIPLSGGTTYIVSGDDKGISVNIQIMRNGSAITISSTQAVNYFMAQDGDYISFCWLWQPSGTVFNNVILKPMIEKGSTATNFEPYTRQSYPLNLGSIELNKIGSYQDYIYKNGGKWYVHKEIGNITLNGTETWGKNDTQTLTNTSYFYSPVIDGTFYVSDYASGVMFSNRFLNTSIWSEDTEGISIANGTNGFRLRINTSTASTIDGLKTWLSSNLTKVLYVLQTATNTEITDTTLINQLNNIEKAYSYNGTTNILQASNDNGFMLGVVSLHGSTFASSYKGEPIITVNSTGLIYLNGKVMEVLSAPVTINCQTMQCYNGSVNMNNEVRVNEFPEIKIGENEVGSSMALTITPNNWRH